MLKISYLGVIIMDKNLKKLRLKQLSEMLIKADSIPVNSLGSRLKDIRKAMGITQKQLSKKTGMDQSVIAKIEKDASSSSFKSISRIAAALNCEFMGAIVSKLPLEEAVKNQAEKKAKKILDHTFSNMAMENQNPGKKSYEERLKELIEEYMDNPDSSLWEDL